MTITNDSTLSEVKQELRDKWNDGLPCPACTQNVQLFERKLNTGITLFLIGLYKLDPTGEHYHHAKEILAKIGGFTTSRDYSILKYWELMQASLNDDETKRTSGYWQITQLGIDFVEGNATVLSHAKVFNKKCYGLTGEQIDVKTALGNKFDYTELMSI